MKNINPKTKVNDNPEMHYVDNEEFYQEMIAWKRLYYKAVEDHWPEALVMAPGPEGTKPRVSESIGAKLWLICNNLSYNKSFIRYSYREEMILDAIENCIKYIHNFDEVKYKSPFSYFTFIAWQAFVRRIAKEKRYAKAIKEDYIKNLAVLDPDSIFYTDENSHGQEQIIQEHVQQFFDNN